MMNQNLQPETCVELPCPTQRPPGCVRVGRSSELPAVVIGGDAPIRFVAPFGMSSRQDIDCDHLAYIETVASAGADMVQELSTYGPYREVRPELVAKSVVPYGTVLTYELFDRLSSLSSCSQEHADDEALTTLEDQLSCGVAYVTIHASLTRELLQETEDGRRYRAISVPSRAGSMIMHLCERFRIDNPLNSMFHRLAQRCASEGAVISLGSSLRPAAVFDALDVVQLNELRVQGELTGLAHQYGADVMLEGLSHATPRDLAMYVELASKHCPNTPITALGPLPTDIAAGLDHIVAAIGVMFAALYGIALVNVVTAKEHMAMPTVGDMVDAIRAARVGAHVAEVIRQGRTSDRDYAMSRARQELNWTSQGQYALFQDLFHGIVAQENLRDGKPCSICRSKCPFITAKVLKGTVE